MLSGVRRFFPNAIIATLFVLGITMGRIPWILIAIGGLVTTVTTLLFQHMLGKSLGIGAMPGATIIASCSLLPIAGGEYSSTPSLWVSTSSFFVAYILMNAVNLYLQKPTSNRNAIGAQQRQGMGLISIIAASVLFVFLLVSRLTTNCETLAGVLSGLVLGGGIGVAWWYILKACGADFYPDIHGVMLGTKPGFLRTNPMACSKK